VADVLRHLERERPRLLAQRAVHMQGVEDLGHGVGGELDVDDRADDSYDASGAALLRGRLLFDSGGHRSLPVFARASAPPTISMISWVISACRAEFASRVRDLISSSALSLADFIARCRAACSDAAASSIAE